MRIDIVTLFPGMVEPVVSESILGRARARGLVDIRVVNLRDYAGGKHRVTDDYQFGGGGGMVLKPEPLFAAVEALRTPAARVVLTDAGAVADVAAPAGPAGDGDAGRRRPGLDRAFRARGDPAE